MLSLLLKMQCDAEIADFGEQTTPLYDAWQSANREVIERLEGDLAFVQRKQTLHQLLPTLSQKTKAGIRKDCETMQRSLQREFAQ